MISYVIIDDEKPARDALELMLAHYFGEKIKVLGKAESLKEGVFAIYKHTPDIVFLDIEMPEENGFNIFNYFQQVTFSVIFTTAYKEYAIKAIKMAALDYILKPIGVEDLKEAIGLYEKRQLSGISVDNIEKLVNVLNPASSSLDKIAFPTFNGFQLEKVNAILYCEADQNYTNVYTINGKVFLVSKPLAVIEKLLPGNIFFRIHRSHSVNLNYIKTYSTRLMAFMLCLRTVLN
ncbi:MAG: LytTR family DNA-binding domain-containing protein [Bacteroidota bacterium]|nr:LytTR family DNA-binding domain-containing protein [Bacteroidota bacterium]